MDIDTAYLIAVAGIVMVLAFGLLIVIGMYSREKRNSKALGDGIRLKESQQKLIVDRSVKCMDVSFQHTPDGKSQMVVTLFNDQDLNKFEQLLKVIKPGIDVWLNSSTFLPSRKAVYLSDATWAVKDGQSKEGWQVMLTEEFIDSLREVRTASI